MGRTIPSLLAALPLVLGLASSSSAVVKSYYSDNQEPLRMCDLTSAIATCPSIDPETYHMSFFVLRNPQGVISVTPSPAGSRIFALQDENAGFITLHRFVAASDGQTTTNAEGSFGPGAILFIRARGKTFANGPQGPFTGSTSAGGQIDWGLVTGFDGAGDEYCASGNGTLCPVIARVEDMSVSLVVPSATYDIGTWTFDASGNFTGLPYIRGTLLGGTANTIWIMNGGFIDNALPALPLIGFGALAAGLLAVGGRTLLQSRWE